MRRAIALIVLGLFIAVDAIAWVATYRAATAPSPEELQLLAGATPTPPPSAVEMRGDGLYEQILLNGEWRYKQTGSELAPPSPSQGEGRGEGSAEYFSPDLDASSWHTMTIPLNWYLAGLNYHGVIWFRREFQADESWRGRAVRLRFDGVDYFADVWLNGQHLGRHQGYFQPFTFDVTEGLNYGARNVLVVRVDSPYEEVGTVWHHHKTLIKGIFEQGDTRPGGGWARAGQEYNAGGIWNDVTLVVSDYVAVNNLQLRAEWPQGIAEGADAVLTATATLANFADQAADVTVALTLTPRNFESAQAYTLTRTATLRRGETTVVLSGTIPGPRLWWSWDRGDPNLYTARLAVYPGVSGQSMTEPVAAYETAFGFREIRVSEDWTWTLNGQRFFPRGSNYISTQWLAETDEEWFVRDVRMMREANLNFIRVYAHVEPAEFYAATDELGILVWQDFPLQWGYTDAPEFVDEALRQERDMVALLYNHPSIVVWCGHNLSPWDAPEMADRVPDYDPRQNKRLDELLREQALELDPSRYVHLNSGTGDAHIYPGWSSGNWWNYADLPGAPFITEYGAQALPNLDTMERIFLPEELNYGSGEVSERWGFHDFQSLEAFNVAHIAQGESIEEFIANSQAYQANLVQFATESYRRAKYTSVQGVFQFMFVEDWPSITWAVVDYYRQPKAGYYALQTAMQPILPSIAPARPARLERERWIYAKPADFQVSLWVVNDAVEAYPQARLVWEIEDGEGQVVGRGEFSVSVPSDGVRWGGVLRSFQITSAIRVSRTSSPYLPPEVQELLSQDVVPSGDYTLHVRLFDAHGQELGRNEFSFAIEPPAETEGE